jgi:predicted ATP-dependent Lon-type protease
MSIADFADRKDVFTAAATAEVPADKPAIFGTVTLHCVDDGAPLQLSMPMLDALMLLNSLRAIEQQFALQIWSIQIGCNLNAVEYLAAQLQYRYDAEGHALPPSLN